MIEKVGALSEVGVRVLAVRACASSRGRLSTVLVGGRPSRNHAQLAMLMPTSFRMICSVSEFLMLCVVRNVGCCCRLVPGPGIVGHAFLVAIFRDTMDVTCLPSGCECASLLLRASGCFRHILVDSL